ncbi:MAG: hypothetical protein KGQ49_02820, partial [Verrucomicrobia bacterium]|nr:hypothetical protein [Verrucomicrobiota bacterium]
MSYQASVKRLVGLAAVVTTYQIMRNFYFHERPDLPLDTRIEEAVAVTFQQSQNFTGAVYNQTVTIWHQTVTMIGGT